MPEETILSRIKSPADLKQLTYPEMTALCGEIRDFLIQTVSQTGGHLSSNLGVDVYKRQRVCVTKSN